MVVVLMVVVLVGAVVGDEIQYWKSWVFIFVLLLLSLSFRWALLRRCMSQLSLPHSVQRRVAS